MKTAFFQISFIISHTYIKKFKLFLYCKQYIPSSIIAVVTFFPVIPWSQAACTFKSKRIFPLFCPVFLKYHCNGKYGSVGISPIFDKLLLFVNDCCKFGDNSFIDGMAGLIPRFTRTKPGCWTAVCIWKLIIKVKTFYILYRTTTKKKLFQKFFTENLYNILWGGNDFGETRFCNFYRHFYSWCTKLYVKRKNSYIPITKYRAINILSEL